MRQKNMRFVWTGLGLAVLGVLFFLGMMGMMPKSNDPAAMMRTVGQVSGVGIGIGLALVVFGLIGKKV
ncbi:MAG TPA: hypothetical protein VGL66_18980 [Caulobacteraceae bacterium]|jgi:hypothetical protein